MHISPSMERPKVSRHSATKAFRLAGGDAGLLRLLAGVDLHEEPRALAHARHFLGERARELGPVDGLDHVEQVDRLAHLVRLQRTDQVELDAGMARFQRRPFACRLLHAVLAEAALARADRLLDDGGGDGLGHGHQLDACGVAAGGLRREGDLLKHQAEPGRDLIRRWADRRS